jgi:DNA-binding Lrp family transcriptional regulator
MLKEILKILEEDARTTPKQLATMTGSSEGEVKTLIKKAEEEQVILKYRTLVNWDRVGDEHIWALIEVKITPQRDVGFDAIAERIYRFPQARTVYLVSGTYDLAVLVMGRSMNEIADFVTQKVATVEGVRGTTTHFLLRRYKEDGEILEGGEGNRRQPVIL